MTATVSEVLQVNDLKVHFPVRDEHGRKVMLRAVDGVTLEVARGETLGLVGESGCGKSTLVRTLFGLNPVAAGSLQVLGRDPQRLRGRARRELRNRMQLVFQDPSSSLNPRMTAGQIIAEPLRLVGRFSTERVSELAAAVGLDESMLARRPAAFSGGQRQRIAIARSLALDPELLVLDEPVSALDVSVQAQVINLLTDLQQRLGLAYLFIAHDLSVVRHISHRVAVMYLGKIVEVGTRSQIFDDPQHPYTRSLLSAIPVADPRQRGHGRVILTGDLPSATQRSSGCPFRTRCPVVQPDCAEVSPTLIHLDPAKTAVACLHPDISQQRIALLDSTTSAANDVVRRPDDPATPH